MKCWGMLLMCVLAAGSAQAGGITSFEPDSARLARDREPMIETPFWLGGNWSMSSLYRPGADGLVKGPMTFAGFGFGATWPWKSRRQGYIEWHYGVRHVRFERRGSFFNGTTFEPYTFVLVERVDMLALRGGVEHRFGRRRTPWCTVGGGTGYALNASVDPTVALELTGRATVFSYPTADTRVGLMLSAGPVWHAKGSAIEFWNTRTTDESNLRTRFELALRFERRLRFPKAVADAE